MRIERFFDVPFSPETGQTSAAQYLNQLGYRAEADGTFRRGSGLFSVLAWNPRARAATVTLEFSRSEEGVTQAELSLDIATVGNMVFAQESEYWAAEADALQASLTQGTALDDDLAQMGQAIFRNYAIRVGCVLGVAAAAAFVLGILGNNPSAGVYAAFGGAVIGNALGSSFTKNKGKRIAKKPVAQTAALQQPDVVQQSTGVQQPVQRGIAIDALMRRDLQSWGLWLGFSGVMSFISGGILSSSWGVILLLIALGSFMFVTPAMHVILGISLIWVGIKNGLDMFGNGSGLWSVFGLVQIFIGIRVLYNFRRFNRAYQNGLFSLNNPGVDLPRGAEVLAPDNFARFMPWSSLAFGLISFVGVILGLAGYILLGKTNPLLSEIFAYGFDLGSNLGVLAFATGLGTLMVHKQHKVPAIIGSALGGLMMMIILILKLL
jgi:hypothetical protein